MQERFAQQYRGDGPGKMYRMAEHFTVSNLMSADSPVVQSFLLTTISWAWTFTDLEIALLNISKTAKQSQRSICAIARQIRNTIKATEMQVGG